MTCGIKSARHTERDAVWGWTGQRDHRLRRQVLAARAVLRVRLSRWVVENVVKLEHRRGRQLRIPLLVGSLAQNPGVLGDDAELGDVVERGHHDRVPRWVRERVLWLAPAVRGSWGQY